MLEPVRHETLDIASGDQRFGKVLSQMLPLLLLMTGMLGALFPDPQRFHREISILEGVTTIRPAATEQPAARPRLKHPDGSPIRVLVVDDEPTLTDLLQMALRYEGWEVRTASDGRHALTLAREFRPDAIVLDIMLPDIDGMQVLSRVRQDGQQTAVLFLTAKDSLEDRLTGLPAGGDD